MSELTLNVITDFLKTKGFHRFATAPQLMNDDYSFIKSKIIPSIFNPEMVMKIQITKTKQGWVLYNDAITGQILISRHDPTCFDLKKEREELTEVCKELYKMGVLAIGKVYGN